MNPEKEEYISDDESYEDNYDSYDFEDIDNNSCSTTDFIKDDEILSYKKSLYEIMIEEENKINLEKESEELIIKLLKEDVITLDKNNSNSKNYYNDDIIISNEKSSFEIMIENTKIENFGEALNRLELICLNSKLRYNMKDEVSVIITKDFDNSSILSHRNTYNQNEVNYLYNIGNHIRIIFLNFYGSWNKLSQETVSKSIEIIYDIYHQFNKNNNISYNSIVLNYRDNDRIYLKYRVNNYICPICLEKLYTHYCYPTITVFESYVLLNCDKHGSYSLLCGKITY